MKFLLHSILSAVVWIGVGIAAHSNALGFDGDTRGYQLGAGIGMDHLVLTKLDLGGYSSRSAKELGFSWQCETGYAWRYFSLGAGYSQSYFAIQTDSGKTSIVTHYPNLGGRFHVSRLFGETERDAFLEAGIGTLLINEDKGARILSLAPMIGVGYEVYRHVLVKLDWVTGSLISDNIGTDAVKVAVGYVFY